MTARRPSDPMGSRLWELEEGYCGESEHVDDLITLAWNIYHARDAALALAERLAGEVERLRGALSRALSTWEDRGQGSHQWHVAVSTMVGLIDDALAAAPPPDAEGNGMAAFAGAWPGDETEEQLLATLDFLDGKGPPPVGEDAGGAR